MYLSPSCSERAVARRNLSVNEYHIWCECDVRLQAWHSGPDQHCAHSYAQMANQWWPHSAHHDDTRTVSSGSDIRTMLRRLRRSISGTESCSSLCSRLVGVVSTVFMGVACTGVFLGVAFIGVVGVVVVVSTVFMGDAALRAVFVGVIAVIAFIAFMGVAAVTACGDFVAFMAFFGVLSVAAFRAFMDVLAVVAFGAFIMDATTSIAFIAVGAVIEERFIFAVLHGLP